MTVAGSGHTPQEANAISQKGVFAPAFVVAGHVYAGWAHSRPVWRRKSFQRITLSYMLTAQIRFSLPTTAAAIPDNTLTRRRRVISRVRTARLHQDPFRLGLVLLIVITLSKFGGY